MWMIVGSEPVSSSGALAVTIDKGAEYRISGASAAPERKEHALQELTTTLLHPTRATM